MYWVFSLDIVINGVQKCLKNNISIKYSFCAGKTNILIIEKNNNPRGCFIQGFWKLVHSNEKRAFKAAKFFGNGADNV